MHHYCSGSRARILHGSRWAANAIILQQRPGVLRSLRSGDDCSRCDMGPMTVHQRTPHRCSKASRSPRSVANRSAAACSASSAARTSPSTDRMKSAIWSDMHGVQSCVHVSYVVHPDTQVMPSAECMKGIWRGMHRV